MKTSHLLAIVGSLALALLVVLSIGVNAEIQAYKSAIKAESDGVRYLEVKLNTALDERNDLVQVIEEMTAEAENAEEREDNEALCEQSSVSSRLIPYDSLPQGAYWVVQINTRSRILVLRSFENSNASASTSTLISVEAPLSCELPIDTGTFMEFDEGKCKFDHGASF